MTFTKILSEEILFEDRVELFIMEAIQRNHGSQYKGKTERRFSNILQGTLKNTKNF